MALKSNRSARGTLGPLILILCTISAPASESFYFTPERVRTARENIRRYEWARNVFDSLRTAADRAVDASREDLARWISPYTPTRALDCPRCGAGWRAYIWSWSEKQPDALRCRICGALITLDDYPANDTLWVRDPSGTSRPMPVYRDSAGEAYFVAERMAYEKLMHVGRWLEALGGVYAITGEEKYAQAARLFLLRLARVYPTYALHDWYHFGTKPWPQAGKVSGWNYQDAVLIVQCGKAYDAIRGSSAWKLGEKELVKDGVFREAARLLTALRPDQGIVNDIPFRYAGVAFAGRILEDPQVMRWVLDDELGVMTFVRSKWFPDGTWCERSPSYGLMVLRNFHEAVEALRNYSDPDWYRGQDRIVGFDLRHVRRLKEIYEQPFRILYPDGSLPPFNDSHAGDKPPFVLADACYSWYGSSVSLLNLAQALGDSSLGRGNVYSLFHRPPDAPARLRKLLGKGLRKQSSYRSDYFGVVAIRGKAHGAQAMLTLQYGGIYGGHDHHDKLDLTLFACGREMLSDLGYVYWAHPERFVWMRRSLAHNTVTVDGINQALTGGDLVLFRTEDSIQVAEADVRHTYSGITQVFDRQIVWIEQGENLCVVDIFRVRGGRYRDWSVHAETEVVHIPSMTFEPVPELPGRDYAYEHLQNVRVAEISEPVQVDWAWREVPRAQLRLRLLSPVPARLYRADAPAERHPGEKGRTLPYLIVRDEGTIATSYVAVWDPFVDASGLATARLRRCESGSREWPVAVELTFAGGERVCVLSSLEDDPLVTSEIDGKAFRWKGRIGVLRLDDGRRVRERWFRAYSE